MMFGPKYMKKLTRMERRFGVVVSARIIPFIIVPISGNMWRLNISLLHKWSANTAEKITQTNMH